MNNGIILYCEKYGRASFWDICKTKQCRNSSCLFSKIVKKFKKDDFFCQTSRRYTSLEEFEKDLPEFTSSPTIERKAVDPTLLPLKRPPVFITTKDRPEIPPRLPEKNKMINYGELARKVLIDAVKEAR